MTQKSSLVSIAHLSKSDLTYLLEMGKEFEKHPNRKILDGRIVATLFFEPSTRTRLSFETAANRLGAKVIGFSDPKVSSSTKGETLKDTIMMVANYSDAIVIGKSQYFFGGRHKIWTYSSLPNYGYAPFQSHFSFHCSEKFRDAS